ncbi:MAG: hypothetical protein LIO96_12835 [Lachnospiraceae bacterium]|nr:hypothetical protein [Lachnospiraceae bacterium]
MRGYGNRFDAFYSKKEELKLLVSVLDLWMQDGGVQSRTKEIYRRYFGRNKNGKMGWERLVNYLSSHIQTVLPILKETARQ